MEKVDIDWENLGYGYTRTDYNYISYWKDGRWDEGKLIEENTVTMSMGSTALHYGQECFEGLKAQTAGDGRVLLFRPDQNAKRMKNSARGVLMPEVPEEKFIDACIQVVKANMRWVPPTPMQTIPAGGFCLKALMVAVKPTWPPPSATRVWLMGIRCCLSPCPTCWIICAPPTVHPQNKATMRPSSVFAVLQC